MSGVTLQELANTLAHAHVRLGTADGLPELARSTGWPALDELLPDGGLPHGIVEVACHATATHAHAFAGATLIATRAIAKAHATDERAFCAWLDPERSLHAPGLVQSAVDVDRLLVVRPEPPVSFTLLGRVAVKVVASGAFDVVILDAVTERAKSSRETPELIVRKLALAAEPHATTVLLLTEPERMPNRTTPWPVAMRLDVTRVPEGLSIAIPKERRGRVQTAKVLLPIEA